MSCYRPMVAIPDYEELHDGKRHYKLNGRYEPGMESLWPGAVCVPCGHCLGCRLDYSRSWADRMILELDHSKKAIFCTLTYDNDHVPVAMLDDFFDIPSSYTLDKRHVQLFMKRLRKKFEDREIRFYLSGEYGSTTQRPHYHAILFGLSLADFSDRVCRGTNELGQAYFISKEFTDIWQFGFTMITDVSWKTCAYVARYVMKKVNSPVECDPSFRNAIPEFALMSRRPGLGAYYPIEHPDMFEFSQVYVRDQDGSKKVSIPKYILKKLELTDKELYDKIIADRVKMAQDRTFIKMQNTDLSFIEMLENEEKQKEIQVNFLKRK